MKPPRTSSLRLSPSQAFTLGFLGLVLLGTFFLSLPLSSTEQGGVSPLQALFTATSAVCVTGLAVVDTGTAFTPFGQWVILALIQLGGLGIMLFSATLLGAFGRRLGLQERVWIQQSTPGLPLSGVGKLSRNIVLFSLACELLGFFVLWWSWADRLGGEAPFYALFHSVSAFCNAGFSLWADSLSQDVSSPVVNTIVMFLISFGGLGYLVCRDAFLTCKKKQHHLSLHSYVALSTSAVLVLLGTVLFWFFETTNPKTLGSLSGGGQFWSSLFQSVTTRTAGFNTIPIGELREETLILMCFLMFIGGTTGSTAGGVKTTTFALLVLAAWSQMRGRTQVVVHHRRVPTERLLQALTLTLVAGATIALATICLNYLESHHFRDILFESISAMATVGLSTGITASLSTPSMLLLCVMMFIGRVGPLTLVASLFAQSPPNKEIRFPQGEINIG